MLKILFQDEHIVAINKPHGLLVHKSSIAKDATEFALQQVRDQIGQRVHSVHRLDRKTGGVLLFALSKEVEIQINQLFTDRKVSKTYWALLRGWMQEEGTIDKQLEKENGTLQDAVTHYKPIEYFHINQQVGRYETARYTLAELKPETGRMHQLRRHMSSLRKPIIGDHKYGDNKHNKFFEKTVKIPEMFLHAKSLSFIHPVTKQEVFIDSDVQEPFQEVIQYLNFNSILQK